MDSIRAVLNVALECLNVRLTFGSMSFTALQFWFALAILSITIWFVKNLFD